MMGVSGRKAAVAVAGAAALAATALPVSPASAQDDTGTTDVDVTVNEALTLEGLTEQFSLTGDPGELVTDGEAVTMTVVGNATAGFTVSVIPQGDGLVPPDPGENPDMVDWAAVEYENDDGDYVALTPGDEHLVYFTDTPPDGGSETITHGYQVDMPFVQADTYSGALEYVLIANP